MKREHKGGNPMDHSYDVIVIGAGETGRSAIQTLNEQGQQAMFIELSPDMIATMICHHPKKNPPSSYHFDDNNQRNRSSNEDDKDPKPMTQKIYLQQQITHTPVGETITYTFHVQEESIPQIIPVSDFTEEFAEVEEIEDIFDQNISQEEQRKEETPQPYSPWQEEDPSMELQMFKSTMDFQPKFMDTDESDNEVVDLYPHMDIANQEKRKNQNKIEDEAEEIETYEFEEFEPLLHHDEIPSYTFEEQSEEEKKSSYEQSTESQTEDVSIDLIQPALRPSSLSKKQAQEISLREKLFHNRTEDHTEFLKSTNEEDPSIESSQSIPTQQEEVDRSSLLHSVLNKPVYSPRESRLRKRLNHKKPMDAQKSNLRTLVPIDESTSSNSVTPQSKSEESPTQSQKIYAIEPFSARRRARAQKKNRMLATVERLQNTMPGQTESSDPQQQVDSTSLQQIKARPEQIPKQDPFTQQQTIHPEESVTNPFENTLPDINNEKGNHDTLKRDNIEFEEPFGEYNSWEDFMYPSQNNRKRKELDEIEKRKIALRGLHNLINNLG